MRYVAAQFAALLHDDLWLANAANANAMTLRLYEHVGAVASLRMRPPEVNSQFPTLAPEHAAALRAWCPFYDWDPAAHQYRWMTAWDTTAQDVDRFAAGVREVVGAPAGATIP
jgi:threonine aldolase